MHHSTLSAARTPRKVSMWLGCPDTPASSKVNTYAPGQGYTCSRVLIGWYTVLIWCFLANLCTCSLTTLASHTFSVPSSNKIKQDTHLSASCTWSNNAHIKWELSREQDFGLPANLEYLKYTRALERFRGGGNCVLVHALLIFRDRENYLNVTIPNNLVYGPKI